MSNIIGLDGGKKTAEQEPTHYTFFFQFDDGERVEATGYFNFLGGFYPSVMTGTEDPVVVYAAKPDKLKAFGIVR